VLSCNALISRMSSEKSFATNLAAIGSQAKKRETGAFQEVLSVRRSHIRSMTLRAWSRSPHKTDLYLVPSEEKVQEKWVIAWVTNQVGRTLINGSRAIARSGLGGLSDNLLSGASDPPWVVWEMWRYSPSRYRLQGSAWAGHFTICQ
jgi:hypothetical protein